MSIFCVLYEVLIFHLRGIIILSYCSLILLLQKWLDEPLFLPAWKQWSRDARALFIRCYRRRQRIPLSCKLGGGKIQMGGGKNQKEEFQCDRNTGSKGTKEIFTATASPLSFITLTITYYNCLCFSAEVWKKYSNLFENALLFPLPTQYNIETQEKLQVLVFNIVWGVGGEVRKLKLYSRLACPYRGPLRLHYGYEDEIEYDFWISNQWHFQSPRSSCWF